MIERRDVGGWMSGERPGDRSYPGERLGRPEEGPRSIPGPGRRFLAVVVDWLLSELITLGLYRAGLFESRFNLWVSVVFGVVNLLLVATAGSTIGQRLLGIRVETLDGRHPELWRAAVRAVLLALAIPALTLFADADRRGLHELASGTLSARL